MPLTDQEYTAVIVYISESSPRVIASGSYTFLRDLSGSLVIPYLDDFPPFPMPKEIFWHTGNNTIYRRASDNSAWIPVSAAAVSGGITSISGTNYGTGVGVFVSISGSNTLNFKSLQGIGGTLVSTIGDTIQISSSVGEGSSGSVDSVFGRTGVVIAQPSDYDASQVDNDSTVVGDFVDDALNNLSSSHTYLSGAVATDINYLETSVTNLSTSVALDINTIETSITNLSTSVATDINNIESSITALSTSVAFDINAIETSITNLSNSVASDINTIETSITNLSTSVASDVNYLEISITNLSTSIASDINNIENSITNLSNSVASDINYINEVIATLSASDITNDSDVVGTTIKDALNTLSSSIISGALTSISGSNYGIGSGIYTSISNSNTLNFRTLQGIGGTSVSTNGDTIQISSSIGGGGNVDSVFGRTGSVVAQPSDYDASQIDNDSTVPGDFVDDALNNLSSSHTYLSGAVATDINTIETSVTNLSTSVATDIDDINNTITILSASDITNDSNVAGSTVKDALNTLSASVVSGGLSSISGTNYGTGTGVFTSVSGSNTLNFRTLSGIGGTSILTSGDTIQISSSVGGGGGDVTSVFGRTGAVVAQTSDYSASQIVNNSTVSGAFVDDALDNLSAEISSSLGAGAWGTFYISSPAGTSISTTPSKIGGTTTAVVLDNFEHSNGRLTYVGSTSKRFHVASSIAMQSSAKSLILTFYVAKNGTYLSNSANGRNIGTSNIQYTACLVYPVTMVSGDYIEIFAATDGGTSTVTVDNAVLSVFPPYGSGGSSTNNAGLFPQGYVNNLPISLSPSLPSSSIIIEPGSCLSDDDTTNLSLDQSIAISITGSGANGLDTGTEQSSTWYYVWLIYNPDTDSTKGLFSTSSVNPTLPSGYTKKRRIGIARNDGSSNFLKWNLSSKSDKLREYYYCNTSASHVQVLSNGSSYAWADIDCSHLIPPEAQMGVFYGIHKATYATSYTVVRVTGSIEEWTPFKLLGTSAEGMFNMCGNNNQIIQYRCWPGFETFNCWVYGFRDCI